MLALKAEIGGLLTMLSAMSSGQDSGRDVRAASTMAPHFLLWGFVCQAGTSLPGDTKAGFWRMRRTALLA